MLFVHDAICDGINFRGPLHVSPAGLSPRQAVIACLSGPKRCRFSKHRCIVHMLGSLQPYGISKFHMDCHRTGAIKNMRRYRVVPIDEVNWELTAINKFYHLLICHATSLLLSQLSFLLQAPSVYIVGVLCITIDSCYQLSLQIDSDILLIDLHHYERPKLIGQCIIMS